MQRTILLAWELGGGRGHALRLAAIGEKLGEEGFRPVFAVHRLDTAHATVPSIEGSERFQAPAWPGQLTTREPASAPRQTTFGDSLGDLGLGMPGALQSLIAAWETLFRLVQPAAIVGDFAPAALLTARGRIPTVAVGNGFTLPPADAGSFARLVPETEAPESKYDEAELLAAANRALNESARPPIGSLPAIFSADRTCIATYAELDPYLAERSEPHSAPFLPRWQPPGSGDANEVFAYLDDDALRRCTAIVQAIKAIARDGIPTRIFAPSLSPAIAGDLGANGVLVEPKPVPFAEIARRSRLIVSHGSLGIASAALAAGIPQVTIPFVVAKRLTGESLSRLGVGKCLRLRHDNPLEAALLAQVIVETLADDKLTAMARSLAPDFAARLKEDPADTVVRCVREVA